MKNKPRIVIECDNEFKHRVAIRATLENKKVKAYIVGLINADLNKEPNIRRR